MSEEQAEQQTEQQAEQLATGIVGRKCGMTRLFQEDGSSIPVTVIEVQPNFIIQVKTKVTDGYEAIQVTKGSKKANRFSQPEAGHFAKAKVEPGEGLWEFRVQDASNFKVGDALTPAGQLKVGQKVKVTGISKGKGYAGVIKRHNFRTQAATHGNSLAHRAPGSTGQNQTPGRVFKGKKMAGQMGNQQCSTRNLEIIEIKPDLNVVMIKGAVPGFPGADVIIRTGSHQ